MTSTPQPTSIYAQQMPVISQELTTAFRNRFELTEPFEADNMVPGDRFGRIRAELLDFNPDRPALRRVRLGAEAKAIQYALVLQVAFEGKGQTDEENYLAAEGIFLSEAVALEHRLALMTEDMNAYGFVQGLSLSSPVDNRLSVSLHDRDTWRLDIVANFDLLIFVKRDARGRHVPLES